MNAKSEFQICHWRFNRRIGQELTSIWTIWMCGLGKPLPDGAFHANQTSVDERRVAALIVAKAVDAAQLVFDRGLGQNETKLAGSEGQSLMRRSFQ